MQRIIPLNIVKVGLALQVSRMTAEKKKLQLEYKAGTAQLRVAQVTIFMNTGISAMKTSHGEAFMVLKRMLLCLCFEVGVRTAKYLALISVV